MIRMLKCAKDSAVKARTQAINQMKALVVTAPAELRETLDGLTAGALVTRCKSLRPGRLDGPHGRGQVRASLPCLPLPSAQQGGPRPRDRARSTHPDGAAPALVSIFGIGPDSAAQPPDRRREQPLNASSPRPRSPRCAV